MKIDFWNAIAKKWRYHPDENQKKKIEEAAKIQADKTVSVNVEIPDDPLAGWEDEDI